MEVSIKAGHEIGAVETVRGTDPEGGGYRNGI